MNVIARSETTKQSNHKRTGLLRSARNDVIATAYELLLIISVALHLTDVVCKTDHLVAVAELVVVPQVEDHGLAIV